MASRVINDLCEKILERERIYAKAFEGDLSRLKKIHSEACVREALQLLGSRQADGADRWDAQGHALAVQRGISSLLQRRVEDPQRFDIDPNSEI
jgi:hypothetical protein